MIFAPLSTRAGTRRTLPLVLLATLILGSCVQVRLLTYPSEFTWLDRSSVKSVMYEMAIELAALEQMINEPAMSKDYDALQNQVVAKIDDIESLASSLSVGAGAVPTDETAMPATNHLLIDEHIDELIEQTSRARMMAANEPPNYYGAGQLVGNCNACHRMR